MAAPAAAAADSSSAISTSVIDGITVYNDYPHHLQRIPPASHPAPFLLEEWIASHTEGAGRQDQFLYERDAQFQLALRSGPYVHRELHTQAGEEWIYVTSGEASIRLIDGRATKDIALSKGSCFLVPAGTPKSLQLGADCNALVMTRARKTKDSYPHANKVHKSPHLAHHNNNAPEALDELDTVLWTCPACGAVVENKEFLCAEYYAQTAELCAAFDSAVAAGVTCPSCRHAYPADMKTLVTDSDATLKTAAALQALLGAPLPLPAAFPAFPSIDSSTHPPPYHLFDWIETNRHLLAPPVGNRMIHGKACQWKVMIVGGPNQRTDYHIDDGEEWFLMIEGDMTLKVVDEEGTVFRDVVIKQGESFLLPANVPHSPQRLANTIGLVIERERFSYELDGLRWYCSNPACRHVLRTFSFRCADLGSQLKTLIQYWYEESPEGRKRRTCEKCGQVEEKPSTLKDVKQFTH